MIELRDPRLSRIFSLLVALVAGGLGLSCAGNERMVDTQVSGDAASKGATKPNVLLIMADDLGWRDVSLGEQRFYRTPHIDKLASQGVRFENAYAASPLCSPTRASILTGRDPARHGVTAPMGHLPEHRLTASLPEATWPDRRAITPSTATRIAFDNETLPEAFRKEGYSTALFGKWHLGGGPHAPSAHGFDFVLGGGPHPGPPSYYSPFGIPGLTAAEEGAYLSDVLVDGVIDWLQQEREQPFFACLWFYQVHAPFQARADLREQALKRLDPNDLQRSATYAAMVQSMDDGVGRVMAELVRLGLDKDTIVVFTSDNGGNQYDTIYGDLPAAPMSGVPPTRNAPLRGGKGTIWEGGVRVPLIVVWPEALADGRVQPGTTRTAFASSTDLYPTLLELAGLPARPDQALDAISLVPALEGRGDARLEVFVHFPHDFSVSGNRAATSLRVGSHKLVRLWADGAGGADRDLLFDLAHDPGEEHDIASEQPKIHSQLIESLEAYLERTSAVVPIPNPDFDPQTERWFPGPETDLSYVADDAGTLLVLRSDQHAASIAAPVGGGIGGHVTMQLDLRTVTPGPLEIMWFLESAPALHPARSLTVPIEADGEWHTLRFAIEAGGYLSGLRLDPIAEKGEVQLRALKLFNVGGDLVREWRPLP